MFKASALCALGITPLGESENPLHEKLPLNGEKAEASRGVGQHSVECRPTQHVVSSFSPRWLCHRFTALLARKYAFVCSKAYCVAVFL